MTFEDILDQALTMLQRRGRVTYGTLQRQFALDTSALEDLKDALLYTHPEVVDDQGRGLRWTGERAATPAVSQRSPTPRRSLRPNAASSRCCFVIWWTPPSYQADSTPKCIETSSVRISRRVPQ